MTDRPDEASRLARLLRDIEELEKTRTALLQRVERTRSSLVVAGNRTDHITDVVASAAEMSMLEHDIQAADRGVEEVRRESSGLAFESESLQETLDEADEELERLSSILVERRGKHSKGH